MVGSSRFPAMVQISFADPLVLEIEWPEEGLSGEAKDLIIRLLNSDPKHRLRAEGVKRHFFFREVEWDTVREQPAPFIPAPVDMTDTSYFDGEFGCDLSGVYFVCRYSTVSSSAKHSTRYCAHVKTQYAYPTRRRTPYFGRKRHQRRSS